MTLLGMGGFVTRIKAQDLHQAAHFDTYCNIHPKLILHLSGIPSMSCILLMLYWRVSLSDYRPWFRWEKRVLERDLSCLPFNGGCSSIPQRESTNGGHPMTFLLEVMTKYVTFLLKSSFPSVDALLSSEFSAPVSNFLKSSVRYRQRRWRLF